VSSTVAKTRPKHLNLMVIRLPVAGFVSIMHRVSGAVLFLMLPLLLWLFQASIQSPESFAKFQSVVSNPLAKLVLLGLLWGYLHHLLAGVRHLFLDLHIGAELETARASSIVVLISAIVLTLAVGVRLW
jgi:succinate dehydrogenase / fumarate reductase cytochrome b subunit